MAKHMFSWLFGKQLTAKDLLRKNQRALNRTIWNIDRERKNMESQEKKIITDLKKMAKEGQMQTLRVLSKDLVRTRRYIQRFMVMKANVQAVSIQILTLESQHAMSKAMLGVTVALRAMNKQFRLPQVQRILQEFERQSVIMGLKDEVMTETIDQTICESEEEVESDTIVAQILDELGLQLKDQLSDLPEAKGHLKNSNQKIPVATTKSMNSSNDHSIDADLQARLDNLRRNDNDIGFPNVPDTKPKRK